MFKWFETITVNRVVSGSFLNKLERYFWSVHHHNKGRTHNILFLLFHLYLFKISIVLSHKLHCLNYFGTITVNRAVSELFFIQLERWFWSVHHQNKSRTHNIFFHCLIYIYFKFILFEVMILIVQYILERSRETEC